MSDEWFVRVQDKEYGPVDVETLLEWKEEGRLIPANPVRREGEVEWVDAGTILALFPPALPPAPGADLPIRRRSFGEILTETLRIYGKGFPQFFALSLLVAIPALGLRLSLAFVNSAPGQPLSGAPLVGTVVAVVMLIAWLAAWPIFLGGLQVASGELAAGRGIRLGDIVQRAKSLWGRIAKLAMFVYGSFMFWLGLPLITMSALASSLSVISILLALLAFAFLVYMAVRLFTKFMFWQQSAALGELEGVEALRESDELARSRAEESLWQRPLYRGLLVLLLWVVVLIGISMAVELPFLIYRLRGVTDVEQAVAMMQALVRAPRPDALTITTYVVSSLVKALFRPLLGIAFVLLYLDARAGFRSRDAR